MFILLSHSSPSDFTPSPQTVQSSGQVSRDSPPSHVPLLLQAGGWVVVPSPVVPDDELPTSVVELLVLVSPPPVTPTVLASLPSVMASVVPASPLPVDVGGLLLVEDVIPPDVELSVAGEESVNTSPCWFSVKQDVLRTAKKGRLLGGRMIVRILWAKNGARSRGESDRCGAPRGWSLNGVASTSGRRSGRRRWRCITLPRDRSTPRTRPCAS